MPCEKDADINVKRALAQTFWPIKSKYDDAESNYQRYLSKVGDNLTPEKITKGKTRASNLNPDKEAATVIEANKSTAESKTEVKSNNKSMLKAKKKKEKSSVTEGKSSLVDEIARTRQQIKHSLQSCEMAETSPEQGEALNLSSLQQRLNQVELDNKRLVAVIEKLIEGQTRLDDRINALEKGKTAPVSAKSTPAVTKTSVSKADDDDVDLFASDEEDEEERDKLHSQRVKAYEEKKSKKAAIIAKSNIILDVKPWDDETDMKKMEESVRAIQLDGLVWGAAKLVPLAYGIFKLQISCVVEDEKVSVDDLQEQIEGLEELVQSVDIAAFNKV